MLYRADVVVDTFDECTQGCEDILHLFYSLLDCSADEFCEGFACFSSPELSVNYLVVDNGLQRRMPSHRYKSRSSNRLQNANRTTIELRKLYFRTVSLTGKLTEGVGGSFKAKSGVVRVIGEFEVSGGCRL